MSTARTARRAYARLATLAALAAITPFTPAAAQPPAVPTAAGPWPRGLYTALVASEAVDQLAVVELGPGGARVARTLQVGVMPTDPDGPHGLAVSPDGAHYYVTTAHGTPFGTLWKFTTATHGFVGRTMLGNFPATLQVTPDGSKAVVVNFNLHGEHETSDVSIVRTDSMQEIARIPTCTMPHGSRIDARGDRHYSVCMMDDLLVEIDLEGLMVARHFRLTKGAERGVAGAPPERRVAAAHAASAHAAHDMSGHGMSAPAAGSTTCSPTWAQPSPDGRSVWVACNGTSELVEIDVASWAMKRRIPAGNGVYNLAMTRDGTRLVTTNKRAQGVSIVDVASGRTLATLPTQRRVVHGVAITSDDRYAFVTVEGIGSEPGTVEIIDLTLRRTIARVDVGQMAGGVDVIPRQ